MHSSHDLLERNTENLKNQLKERVEALDMFLDGIHNQDDEEGMSLRPQDMLSQLIEAVRLPIRLSPEQLRRLPDNDKQVLQDIRQQIETTLTGILINRLIGAFERRLEEELGLRSQELVNLEWAEVCRQLVQKVEDIFDRRINRLIGPNGQLANDLDAFLGHLSNLELSDQMVVQMLMMMSQGSRVAFDARTHRKGTRR